MMKRFRGLKQLAFILALALLLPVLPAQAASDEAQTPKAFLAHPFEKMYEVQVKSVLNEKVDGGIRLAAVLYMKSKAEKVIRVPDFEVRVKTKEGIVYTLDPSSANPRSIEPQSRVELSYLRDIPRPDGVKVTELSLVDVDWEVYPKKETVLVTVPVESIVWNGKNTTLSFPGAQKEWGETFVIPGLDSPLAFTPVRLTQEVQDGQTKSVVKFLVHNPSDSKEYVPPLALEGVAADDTYPGKMLEQTAVALDPGEDRYVHFAIDTDKPLNAIHLMIPETFVGAAQGQPQTIAYQVGRLHIRVPGLADVNGNLSTYPYGKPIAFDPVSDFEPGNVDISLVEFHIYPESREGYQMAMAKFKITNKQANPVSVPVFQTELAGEGGFRFAGHRQQPAAQIIPSGSSVTVNYAFTLPETVESESFILKILDNRSAYQTPVAELKVVPQETDPLSRQLKVYPYDINIKHWELRMDRQMTLAGGYMVYNLELDLEVTRDKAFIPNGNLPRIKFELIDEDGETLAVKYAGFTGAGRLQNGDHDILFSDYQAGQFDSTTYVNVYEVIDTDIGEGKRLLATLKRGF